MDFLSSLNEKQYEAVTSNSKYLRIIAGAGSGKTRVLTYRIAYLLSERGYRPYEILAITFTNKVAKEMKERTKNLLPDFDLSSLKISTFHSFCNYFLRCEINVLGFPKAFTIFDEDDKKRLIKDICVDYGEKRGSDFVDLSIEYISKHKCKGNLPSEVKYPKDNQEKKLLEIFKEYEKRKNAQYSLDFDDLLIYTVLILDSYPEIRLKYSSRYKEILVDEFQDTNKLQFKLMCLLKGQNTGFFVVGDPDQNIYSWRGSETSIIIHFEDYFSPLNTIILNQNYRSTKNIIEHSNSLIAYNKERVKKDLFSNNEKGKEITIIKQYDSEAEAREVVSKIIEIKNRDKVDYNSFTVLYRSSYCSRAFEKELISKKIPYQVFSGIKFYERKEIKDAMAYFNLMLNPLDNVSILRILNVPRRGIGEKTVLSIKQGAKQNNLSIYNYLKDINSFKNELGTKILSEINKMVEAIENCKSRLVENYENYAEVLNDFLKDIGYIDYLANLDEEEDRLGNIKEFINDIRSYLKNNPESSFDEYLQNITLLTSQDELDSTLKKVNLMTVHTAKGLEFDYVFLVNFQEGIFPNSRALFDNEKGLEEERRLAYVAFTRAKKELYISYNYGYNYSSQQNGKPSSFIKEANLDIIQKINNYNYNNNQKLYSFGKPKEEEKKNENIVYFGDKIDSIDFKKGDRVIHKAFGEGTVEDINGDVLIINFDNFGIKKMSNNVKFLTKKDK